VVPDADYRIKLPAFEGPLDLLLFLIRKSEIDIYDIPIESVTRQYLDVIRSMQQLDLEVAGEFFVMAATLMEIKSRMLLPKGQHAIDPNAEDDDAMDPRWELVHQLLQYKKFKEAARQLDELAVFQRDKLVRFVSTLAPTEDERPLKGVDRIELWNSFNIVLRRLAEKLVVGEIKDEQVTVSDQMETILKRIETEKTFIFSDLFPDKTSLRILVATFIAVLELTRLGKLRVRQTESFDDIVVSARDDAPVPLVADPVIVRENTLETPSAPDTLLA
jgi:segregation and condensation protein A